MEILIFAVLIGLIPAYVAQKKGRSFGLWWLYGAALFIVALPHALIIAPLPGSDEAMKKDSLVKSSAGVDFAADGVIEGVPFRRETDGSVVGLFDGRMIKLPNEDDLRAMIKGRRATG